VAQFIARLRREGPPPPVVRPPRGVRRQLAASLASAQGPTARRAAFLLVRPAAERHPEETAYLDLLARADPEIAPAATLARAFLAMARERQGERLSDWIGAAERDGPGPLRRFAQGLQADVSAVLAGLTLPVSNGQLEGQINRLKSIKRQMFGRANFDLLRRRVLYAA